MHAVRKGVGLMAVSSGSDTGKTECPGFLPGSIRNLRVVENIGSAEPTQRDTALPEWNAESAGCAFAIMPANVLRIYAK